MTKQWEHSTDGRTWHPIDPSSRSIVANLDIPVGAIWPDEFGNLYRWLPSEQPADSVTASGG